MILTYRALVEGADSQDPPAEDRARVRLKGLGADVMTPLIHTNK